MGLTFFKDKLSESVVGYVDFLLCKGLGSGKIDMLCFYSSWLCHQLEGNFAIFVALSTTEAEYMEIIEAVREAIRLQGLVSDLGLVQ